MDRPTSATAWPAPRRTAIDLDRLVARALLLAGLLFFGIAALLGFLAGDYAVSHRLTNIETASFLVELDPGSRRVTRFGSAGFEDGWQNWTLPSALLSRVDATGERNGRSFFRVADGPLAGGWVQRDNALLILPSTDPDACENRTLLVPSGDLSVALTKVHDIDPRVAVLPGPTLSVLTYDACGLPMDSHRVELRGPFEFDADATGLIGDQAAYRIASSPFGGSWIVGDEPDFPVPVTKPLTTWRILAVIVYRVEARLPRDAGLVSNAAPPNDAGLPSDASPPNDAGLTNDAAASSDAAPPNDAGLTNDASVSGGGSVSSTMSDELTAATRRTLESLPAVIDRWSGGRAEATITIIDRGEPISQLSQISADNMWISPEALAASGVDASDYDSVFVIWAGVDQRPDRAAPTNGSTERAPGGGPSDAHWFDWSGLGGAFGGRTYANILVRSSDETDRAAEVFVHEWIHGLVELAESRGAVETTGVPSAHGSPIADLHDPAALGYDATGLYGYRSWYGAFLRGGDDKHSFGLTDDMWRQIALPVEH